jgi:hypothetical protein
MPPRRRMSELRVVTALGARQAAPSGRAGQAEMAVGQANSARPMGRFEAQHYVHFLNFFQIS